MSVSIDPQTQHPHRDARIPFRIKQNQTKNIPSKRQFIELVALLKVRNTILSPPNEFLRSSKR